MYEQVIQPNTNFPYVGGLCEGFVEGSFGQASAPYKLPNGQWTTSGVWPSATAAWQTNYGNTNHEYLPPSGVSVPVYFELGSTQYGHVAISLPDGRIISSSLPGYNKSGYVYKNLDAMILDYANNNKYCSYLGWSEYVGKARAVKLKEESMKVTPQNLKYLYLGIYAEDVPDSKLAKDSMIGWDYAEATQVMLDYANKNNYAYWQVKPKLEKEIEDLKKKSEYVKVSDLYIKKG